MAESDKKSEGVVTFKSVGNVAEKKETTRKNSSTPSHTRKSVRIWTEKTGVDLLNLKAWNNAVAENRISRLKK